MLLTFPYSAIIFWQVLYILCIITAIPDKFISVCITVFYLFFFCVSHKHSILMFVLFIAYRKFDLFSLCLENLLLFVVLNLFKVTVFFFQFCLVFFYRINIFFIVLNLLCSPFFSLFILLISS